ncbi:MAG: S8 family serine peptidase [Bdellovibrionaceae bacterium]|jgi:subtilisin family serine protease|nr:S8 family serine peptidase [Pseudobdellovibrionaceae bacterium]
MNKALRIGIIGTALLLAACGNQVIPENQIRQKAPTSKDDLGILLKADNQQELSAFIKAHPEAKFRPIHGQTYEVFAVSEKDIQSFFPEAQLEKNQYISLQKFNKPTFSLKANNSSKIKPMAENTENPFAEFENCQRIIRTPIAKLKADRRVEQAKTYDGGLQFTAFFEKNNSYNVTNTLFFVEAPSASSMYGVTSTKPLLKIDAQDMGSYIVHLYAKSIKDDVVLCSDSAVQFLVTGNDPLIELTQELKDINPSVLDLNVFEHLKELGVEQAWEETTGVGQVIAIIDSGVNYNHPFLRQNINENKNEIPGNGIDDDQNGYIDDVAGYDFINHDAMPFDDLGHGSHVAGLAAGHIFGVAHHAKIMPLKALGPMGGDLASIVKAVYYAVDNGASVINMSLGGYARTAPDIYLEAFKYAEDKDVVIIAASGNGDDRTGQPINTDELPNFPSALENENIISVAASAKGKDLTSYSNFGKESVDVVAPGGSFQNQLISTFYSNSKNALFMGMQGTSMAAPVVAGVVALMKAKAPHLPTKTIKRILMSAGKVKNTLIDKVKSGRQITAYDAVRLLKGQEQILADNL